MAGKQEGHSSSAPAQYRASMDNPNTLRRNTVRRAVIALLVFAGAAGAFLTPSVAHDPDFGMQSVSANAWDWGGTRHANAQAEITHWAPLIDHHHSGTISGVAHVGSKYDGGTGRCHSSPAITIPRTTPLRAAMQRARPRSPLRGSHLPPCSQTIVPRTACTEPRREDTGLYNAA